MPWITTPIVLALSLALAQGAEPRITYVTGSVSVSPTARSSTSTAPAHSASTSPAHSA
jgi:hypothetical protein